MPTLTRQLTAEWLGTLFLVATVVGSGIMADQLSGGNDAIALLGNTLATGAILVVLILMLAPVSGAHFNPAVTLAFALRGELSAATALAFIAAQCVGGVTGTMLAHFMFDLDLVQISTTSRTGPNQWGAEFVAAFGLVTTILATLKHRPDAVPYAVGLFISAGYWFTSSTSFANPAVALARGFSDTFSGIAPGHVPAFMGAEFLGAATAVILCRWLLDDG